jgi:hypothetical protein
VHQLDNSLHQGTPTCENHLTLEEVPKVQNHRSVQGRRKVFDIGQAHGLLPLPL